MSERSWMLRLPVLVLLGTACRSPSLCTSEYRFVDSQADLVMVGQVPDTGYAWFGLGLNQWRGAESTNSITWGFKTPQADEQVQRVDIRQGPGPTGGRLLYQLPTWDDPPWVPPALAPVTYSGPVNFADFFEIVLAGDAHVEFTFHDASVSSLTGVLRVVRERDWGGKDTHCS